MLNGVEMDAGGDKDPLDGLIVYATTPGENGGGDQITVLYPPPANGIIPSPPGMGDVEDCPPLVSSDEEVEEIESKTNGESG
jgi:hypothetical protein